MLAVNMNDIVRYSQELEVRKVSLPTVVDFCFCCLPSNQSSQRLFFPTVSPYVCGGVDFTLNAKGQPVFPGMTS